MSLILEDRWDLYLRNGAQVAVHARSLTVAQDSTGNITGITTADHEGIASSLVAVVPSEVVAVIRRREQGTLCTGYRLAGRAEYLRDETKSVVMRDIVADKPAGEIATLEG